MLRAIARRNAAYCIIQSNVSSSVTGTTSETTLVTITIPGSAMGPNGSLRIMPITSCTNNANAKTFRIRVAGNSVQSVSLANAAGFQTMTIIRNRNSASSQMIHQSSTAFSATGTAMVTTAVDTNSDFQITITGQLATSTDTLTVEGYSVEILPS